MNIRIVDGRPTLDIADEGLTAGQLAAMQTNREMAVTAGAGAGKTHVLSLRYVALLFDLAVASVTENPRNPRPSVESVLVLTFTEKAAGEMADRCYRRLLTLAERVRASQVELDQCGPGWYDGLCAALDVLLDTFDRATISTFHAFCMQIVREFPAACRTDPGFEPMEPVDAIPLRRAACEQALADLGRRSAGELSQVLDALGSRKSALSALEHLVAQRGRAQAHLHRLARGEVGMDELLEHARPAPHHLSTWLEHSGFDLVDQIVQIIGGRSTAPAYQSICALRERGRPTDTAEQVAWFRDLVLALTYREAGQRHARELSDWRFMGVSRNWDYQQLQDAREALRRLPGMRQIHRLARQAPALPWRADASLLEFMKVFAPVALDAIDNTRKALDTRHALDFDEMILRAAKAVEEHAAVRMTLQERFAHIMVDEFQDTDLAQWQIVRTLGRPGGAPSTRLFVVGDAKQAIYRFRGGDVTVFEEATRELAGDPVVLPDNFRSQPRLIGWFNSLFGTLLRQPADPNRQRWEAAYHPLEAARSDAGGSISLYTHAADNAAAIADEAEGIARLLSTRVLPGVDSWAEERYADRAAHPAPPIAILLRTRLNLAVFEQALRRHRVPFLVAGGTGFWQRAEIVDLVNTVHALVTRDPASVIGALRSPLWDVPDPEISTWFEPYVSAEQAIDAWCEGALHTPELARAHLDWRRLEGLVHRIPAAQLLREIVGVTHAVHAWALLDDGGAAERNARRLIELAGRFDGRGADGVLEASEWFLGQMEAAVRESEAALQPDKARVILMTVHASKGLEFPMVIVPELHQRMRGSRGRIRSGRIRSGAWAVATTVPDPLAAVRDTVDPGLLEALRIQAEDEELAEHRRLLYVAVTRARDHLVLLGAADKPSPRKTAWMDLLRLHHGDDLQSMDGLVHRPLADLLELEALPMSEAVPPAAKMDAAPVYPWDAPHNPRMEIAPSSLDLYISEPVTWYRTFVMDIPALAASRVSRDRIVAITRGEVVHSLLEDDLAHSEEALAIRWAAATRAAGLSAEERENHLPEVRRHVQRAATDPRLRRALDAPGYPELDFRLDHGQVVLRGQIDRLWLDQQTDQWVVLDYKSERITRKGSMVASIAHARQLLAYGWAARTILRARGDQRTIRGELYYTETGEFFTLATWDDDSFAAFGDLLDEVAAFASLPWDAVRDGGRGAITSAQS